MNTEIISFYADLGGDTYYSDHATRLKKNCEQFNISYDIREHKPEGSYRLNCLAKPKFILDVIQEKQKSLAWIDVDAQIHQPLTVLDELSNDVGCDMAFPILGNTPQVCFMYFAFNEKIIKHLQYWVKCCEENIQKDDHKLFDHEIFLTKIFPECYHNLMVKILAPNYSIWPGSPLDDVSNPNKMITLGIASNKSKEDGLRDMGLPENVIDFNLLRK